MGQHVGCEKSGLCCELAKEGYIFSFEEFIDCLLKIIVAQGLLKIYKNIPENGDTLFGPTGLSLWDAKCSLAISCKSALPKVDIT
jgi:hypothetical protein